MSRIGKAPIALANGVETKINGQNVEVKGPKGTLNVEIPAPIAAEVEDNEIRVVRPDDHRENRALHGLSRSLINNAVVGVTEGYTIKMEIFGVGYRVAQKGKDLSSLWVTKPDPRRLLRELPSLPMAPRSCPSPVLTSKSSDRSLRTSVVFVRTTRTRARASATPASRSVARSERRVSNGKH